MLLHSALWLALAVTDRGALLREALAKEAVGDDAAALTQLEALAQSQLDWDVVRLEAARLRLKRGEELWRAQAHLEMARALAPENARAHYLWGLLMEEQHNGHEAIEAFRTALVLRPDYAEARYRLGARLLTEDKASEAASLLGQYAKNHPQEWGAHLLWAMALEKSGDDASAAVVLKALLTNSPVKALAATRLIALYERTGDKKKADALRAAGYGGKPKVMRPLRPSR